MREFPDVVIVGGGVIGLSCAWRMAQSGRSVLLLERDECGAGASLAALGALIPASPTHRGPTQSGQRASLWAWPAFADELHDEADIDVGYVRCGSLDLLHSEQRRTQAAQEVSAAVADWPALPDGPVMRLLSQEEAQRLEPEVRCDELGARWCRVSARVSPARLIASLRAACRRHGVEIRNQTLVTQVDTADGAVTGVRTTTEMIRCGAVLVAAGAWTAQLAGVPEQAAPVQPVRGQAIAVRATERLFGHIIKRRSIYLLPQQDDEIQIGSTTERDAGFDRRSTPQGVGELTRGAIELVPRIASGSLTRMWAGLRPEPSTHQPIMGPVPGFRGLLLATGHFKTGLSWAPLAGQIMFDWLTRGACAEPYRVFAPEV